MFKNCVWIVTLLAAVAILTACSKKPEDQVVGTWKFDTANMTFPAQMEKVPGFEQGKKQMIAGFEKMRFNFKADSTYSVSGVPMLTGDDTGKWSIKDRSISMVPTKGDASKQPPMTLSDDGSKIHLTLPTPVGDLGADLIKA